VAKIQVKLTPIHSITSIAKKPNHAIYFIAPPNPNQTAQHFSPKPINCSVSTHGFSEFCCLLGGGGRWVAAAFAVAA
jgi:hypothetical protein